MLRRPPISTRTDTLFPYTTLFRSDADVDGSHIQVLLLTLFFKHFPRLVEAGHVYVARPPLFRVDVPAAGKRPARKVYCLDQGELDAVQDKMRKDGIREGSWSISRFQGRWEERRVGKKCVSTCKYG